MVKPVSWLTASSELIDKIGREPALVAALFHTTERYPITKSVAGKRAAYVAVAVKRQPSVPAPFAEVKAKVEEMLALQRARAAAKEAASNFAAKLACKQESCRRNLPRQQRIREFRSSRSRNFPARLSTLPIMKPAML